MANRKTLLRVASLLAGAALSLGLLVPSAAAATAPTSTIPAGQLVTTVLIPSANIVAVSAGGSVSPMWGCAWNCLYLANVTNGGINKSLVSGAAVQGNGPMQLTLGITIGQTNNYSANVGIAAGIVTAGTGVDIGESYSVDYQASVNVPSGSCWRLQAYNIWQNVNFQVWDQNLIGNPSEVGWGWAWGFNGYEVRRSNCI